MGCTAKTRIAVVAAVVALAMAGAGCTRKPEVVVFYASSLSAVLGDAAESFQRRHPDVRVRIEPSGSQVAARKVAELGMRADIVAVADASIVGKMMIPGHASWSIVFATNEIVVAHKDHSKWTDEITVDNWTDILTRSGVRLGRADPDTAPNGYHTLMVWQLAEMGGAPGLAAKLLAQCAKQHVVHDEAELLALLESRAIDYAFLFRSTAEDHHLKILGLPPGLNLSRPDLAPEYAKAKVSVRMKQGQGSQTLVGAPVTYGLTIPKNARNPAQAAELVRLLVGEEGKRLLVRRGFRTMDPVCQPCDGIPPELGAVLPGAPREGQ